jgi:hypothetical protein
MPALELRALAHVGYLIGARRTEPTDWRITNLPASRFWPRRGIRTTFLRLHRSIP